MLIGSSSCPITSVHASVRLMINRGVIDQSDSRTLSCLTELYFCFQCKKKYETAEFLLQGLEEDAHVDSDRALLRRCIHPVCSRASFVPSPARTVCPFLPASPPPPPPPPLPLVCQVSGISPRCVVKLFCSDHVLERSFIGWIVARVMCCLVVLKVRSDFPTYASWLSCPWLTNYCAEFVHWNAGWCLFLFVCSFVYSFIFVLKVRVILPVVHWPALVFRGWIVPWRVFSLFVRLFICLCVGSR